MNVYCKCLSPHELIVRQFISHLCAFYIIDITLNKVSVPSLPPLHLWNPPFLICPDNHLDENYEGFESRYSLLSLFVVGCWHYMQMFSPIWLHCEKYCLFSKRVVFEEVIYPIYTYCKSCIFSVFMPNYISILLF